MGVRVKWQIGNGVDGVYGMLVGVKCRSGCNYMAHEEQSSLSLDMVLSRLD